MSSKLSLLVNFIGVDKLSGSLRNIIGLGRKGSTSLKGLTGESRKLQAQLRKVQQELASSTGNVSELIDRERQLKRAIEETNRQIEQRKRLNAIEADQGAMLARGEELKSRGTDNIVAGASLAAPLLLAVKAAGEFSSGMVDIQQKADLTDKATRRLSNNIITMANRAKTLPEDMRAGLDVLLAKGMDLDGAQKALGPAARLATAYKVEIPDAAGAAYSAISNLKVPASQTSKILDIMATAGNEGAFEVRNMARHFPALTAQLAALDEKGTPAVANLSAALQVAMRTAGSEDEAGNNIANLLAKINAPGTIKAFEKNFGVNLPAAMKKLTDEGYSSLEAIAMITEKATGGDMKKLGFAFEDQQARMGLLAMIQNLEEFRRIRAAALKSDGTVDKAFDQRVLNDASVSWRAFIGQATSLGVVLGTTLLPVVTQVLAEISRAVGWVSAWAQRNPELAGTIIKLVAGLAAFRIGLGAAQFAFGTLLGPLARGITLFRQYRELGSIAAVFPRIARGAAMLKTAFMTLRIAGFWLAKGLMRAGLMMLANPIVLAITVLVAAIAGAAYLIYTHWDKIKAAFTAGVQWLMGLGSQMMGIGKAMIAGLVNGIKSAGSAVWSTLKNIVMGGIQGVKDFLGIKSPSRVFMEIGGQTAEGMAIGIDRRGRRAIGAAGRMAAGVTAAAALGAQPLAAQSIGSAAGSAQAGAAGITVNATIHIAQQPGEDATELARRVKREIERLAKIEGRGSYEDDA